jgi:GntR family transcriptional regulator, transcriptional repressor for pyruvate dehydrogenase complex
VTASPRGDGSRLELQQVERRSAADAVRSQVLALIERGELRVGDKLPSEHDLARAFGVSRPIVREGLGALRAAGILESRSGSGTYVRSTRPGRRGLQILGRYAPEDLYEVRVHLEIPGAGLAAQRRTAGQLAALSEIVARHRVRTAPDEWIEDDLAFHVLLAEATGNELQARLVRDIRELQHEMNVAVARVTELEAPLQEHLAILRAVERRDAQAAEAAMAAHLKAILGRTHAAADRDVASA